MWTARPPVMRSGSPCRASRRGRGREQDPRVKKLCHYPVPWSALKYDTDGEHRDVVKLSQLAPPQSGVDFKLVVQAQ